MDPIVVAFLYVMTLSLGAFPIAYRLQAHVLRDIPYGFCFLSLLIFSLYLRSEEINLPIYITGGLVVIWSLRVWFLAMRVNQRGRDRNFNKIRVNPIRFFGFFLVQGFMIWIAGLPLVWYMLHRPETQEITVTEAVGWTISFSGFVLEAVADYQKMVFKSKEGHRQLLYMGGLYKYIRYPNYLGEILFWIGIAIISSVIWEGVRYISILSPILIILFLVKVSGISYLERGRQARLGDDPAYQSYIASTAKLIPGIY